MLEVVSDLIPTARAPTRERCPCLTSRMSAGCRRMTRFCRGGDPGSSTLANASLTLLPPGSGCSRSAP